MTEYLTTIYHLRRALQLLAAFTGEEELCEVAAALDAVASALWKISRLPD